MALYITALIILLIIGFIKILFSITTIIDRINYQVEYQTKYREYIDTLFSEKEDIELYQWLTINIPRMQSEMGSYGAIPTLIEGNYKYTNLQVLSNLIPYIRSQSYEIFSDLIPQSFMQRNLSEKVRLIDDALLRYHGYLLEKERLLKQKLKNPFSWLKEGVQTFVTFPISLMYWTGLIKYTWYLRISDNFFVKLLNFIVIIIGLVSSIITIVTGYDPFIGFLTRLGWLK